MLYDDLTIIKHKLSEDIDTLHVYAIGDVHVGSRQFNEDAIKKKIQIIQDDPNGALCLCGDLGDYGLKNSKTNVYEATMQPHQQKEYIYELFLPIKDKIVACVPGNHEDRITRETGLSPMYDICVLWGIPEVYRENLALVQLQFGQQTTGRRSRCNFFGMVTHGSGKYKHAKFIKDFDGIDFAISGHIHTPSYTPHGKIRIDHIHGVANHVPYKEIVVDANLTPGGYGLKKEYEIPTPPELQCLELSDASTGNRHHKVINYYTQQI